MKQVTGPVQRFCRDIASQGYLVVSNESFHEFEKPGYVIPYDVAGTDAGNRYKIEKELSAYDEDATLALDFLEKHPNCNGKLGTTGMCLGGHLAFRCAFDVRVRAACAFFATDIHAHSLGKGKMDDSLQRCGEIEGEILMIFGRQDTHVPVEGRRLIKTTLEEKGVNFMYYEPNAQHAFIRDESSKDRYDAALTKVCFEALLELFHRNLYCDWGEADGEAVKLEHVC